MASIEKIGEFDLPSEVVSEAQARSFCVRALRPAATRINAGNPDWEEVEIHWDIDNDTFPKVSFNFAALHEVDDDDKDWERYALELSLHYPLNEEWDQIFVNEVLGVIVHDEDGGWTGLIDRRHEDGTVGEKGYFTIEERLEFKVRLRSPRCTSKKSLVHMFYDEDSDLIEARPAFYPGAYEGLTTSTELENLTHFGEVVLDAERREAEQSQVTCYDVKNMCGFLQRCGLVSKRLKPILEK